MSSNEVPVNTSSKIINSDDEKNVATLELAAARSLWAFWQEAKQTQADTEKLRMKMLCEHEACMEDFRKCIDEEREAGNEAKAVALEKKFEQYLKEYDQLHPEPSFINHLLCRIS